MTRDDAFQRLRYEDTRQSRKELAKHIRVSEATLSRWLNEETAPQGSTVDKLVAWAEALPPLVIPPPIQAPSDYWRGVLYAAEAMAETTARLLREAREGDTETLRARAVAAIPPVPIADRAASGTSPRRPRRASG